MSQCDRLAPAPCTFATCAASQQAVSWSRRARSEQVEKIFRLIIDQLVSMGQGAKQKKMAKKADKQHKET